MDRRSAALGWVAIIAFVLAWDVLAPRVGVETLSACWRRWRRERPLMAEALCVSTKWLDQHLAR